MRKTILTISLVFGLICLGGCSKSNANALTGDFASIAGDDISTNEGNLILSSAQENFPAISKMAMNMLATDDDSSIYNGSLSGLSTYISETSNGVFNSYSNHMLEETTETTETKKTAPKTLTTSYEKEIERMWAGAPVESSVNGGYSLLEEESSLDKNGNVLTDTFKVANSFFSSAANLDDAWGIYLTRQAGGINQLSSRGSFIKTSDTEYVFEMTISSLKELSNPLYPSDSTKEIESYDCEEVIFYFSKKTDGGFFFTKVLEIEKRYVLTNFSFEKFKEPMTIFSLRDEIDMAYETKTAGTIPTYKTTASTIPQLYLVAFPTANYSTSQFTSSPIYDVTPEYKALNPDFKGYAFDAIVNLTPLYYYAFSTSADLDASPRIYDKWGFSNIDSAAIKFGTITLADINGENYFRAQSGTYDLRVLLSENETLTYLGVSYLEA